MSREEFDRSDGKLYLSVGPKGYYKYRSDDKKDKYYALQGKKLPVEMPSSNTWTATVKINIDDNWFSSNDGRRRAEFRVDLVDGDGNTLKNSSPAIALVKGGSGAPVLKYYNPKAQGSWGMANRFVNGDKETEDLTVEEGWHSLLIKANQRRAHLLLRREEARQLHADHQDVYPSYIALNVYNYDRPQMVEWDNVTLYDGAISSASSPPRRRTRRMNAWRASTRKAQQLGGQVHRVHVRPATAQIKPWKSTGRPSTLASGIPRASSRACLKFPTRIGTRKTPS